MIKPIRLRTIRPVPLFAAALASAQFALSAVAFAQIPKPGAAVPPVTLAGSCTVADKLAVTNLVLSPAQPTPGQSTTVTMTIKNQCNVASTIPWEIQGNTAVIASGSATNVGAGQSVDVKTSWTAKVGQNGFFGWVDPKKQNGESQADRGNNQKTLIVSVAAPTPPAPPAPPAASVDSETRVLDYNKAKNAGARFADVADPGSFGCSPIGQRAPVAEEPGGYTITFEAHCLGVGHGRGEAFSNFRLKNGWIVEKVGDPVIPQGHPANWEWLTKPVRYSDNPEMKMSLALPGPGDMWVYVQVLIKGPRGTCPYEIGPGSCP